MSKTPPQSPSPEEKAKQIYHTWFCKVDSKEALPQLYKNLLGKTYPCSQNEEYGQVKEWERALLRDLVMPLQEELRKESICGIPNEDLFCLALGNAALEAIDESQNRKFGSYPGTNAARGRNKTLFSELRKWYENNRRLEKRRASIEGIDWVGSAGGRLFVLALYWATREENIVCKFKQFLEKDDLECKDVGSDDNEKKGGLEIEIECIKWMMRWNKENVKGGKRKNNGKGEEEEERESGGQVEEIFQWLEFVDKERNDQSGRILCMMLASSAYAFEMVDRDGLRNIEKEAKEERGKFWAEQLRKLFPECVLDGDLASCVGEWERYSTKSAAIPSSWSETIKKLIDSFSQAEVRHYLEPVRKYLDNVLEKANNCGLLYVKDNVINILESYPRGQFSSEEVGGWLERVKGWMERENSNYDSLPVEYADKISDFYDYLQNEMKMGTFNEPKKRSGKKWQKLLTQPGVKDDKVRKFRAEIFHDLLDRAAGAQKGLLLYRLYSCWEGRVPENPVRETGTAPDCNKLKKLVEDAKKAIKDHGLRLSWCCQKYWQEN